MKSSFKKIQKGTSSQKAHFGHPDLDAIFYNSLSKGHLMVLEEDHPTTNYLSLLRYYVSSNYHKQIPVLIYDSTPQKWKHLICPKKKQKKQEAKNIGEQKKSQIAWRYDKMNINLNQLIISDEIDFLDLVKEIQKVDSSLLHSHGYQNCSLQEFYKNIQSDFINCHEDEKDTKPKKILLSSMPSYFYNDDKFSSFLHALRCLTRSSHTTTLITVPSIIKEQVRKKLLLYCDYYLQIGKINQGYDDFSSTLTILKEVQTCQIRTKYRGISIWGIKNKKKQLRIEALYQMAVREQKTEKEQSKEQKIDF